MQDDLHGVLCGFKVGQTLINRNSEWQYIRMIKGF